MRARILARATTATVEPGSGRPIEPGFTTMSTVPKLPTGSPNSLEPYWSITVTPQCSRKKRTTSAFIAHDGPAGA
jgi:hypothetical protein